MSKKICLICMYRNEVAHFDTFYSDAISKVETSPFGALFDQVLGFTRARFTINIST